MSVSSSNRIRLVFDLHLCHHVPTAISLFFFHVQSQGLILTISPLFSGSLDVSQTSEEPQELGVG